MKLKAGSLKRSIQLINFERDRIRTKKTKATNSKNERGRDNQETLHTVSLTFDQSKKIANLDEGDESSVKSPDLR